MRSLLFLVLTASLGLVAAPGCDGDGDADADGDGDGDADADADADGDGDGDADGDADADADADTEGDGDSDSSDADDDGSEMEVSDAACAPAGSPAEGRALVALEAGNASVVDVSTRTVTPSVAPDGAISSDSVMRYHDGAVYVVNRYGYDEVVVLDASDFSLVRRFSTGAGTNPQDVAVESPSRAYVPLYGTGEVLVCDPTASEGEEIISTIDLTDIDPSPSPTSAVLIGSELFVALAFVDPETMEPTRDGMVAVVDTSAEAVVAQIELGSANPYARMVRVPGSALLVVDEVADFGGEEGCFEVVDTRARGATCVVENGECGGWAMSMAATSTGHVFAVTKAGWFGDGALCHFTIDGALVHDSLDVGIDLLDVALNDRCELYAADLVVPDGIWVIDPGTESALVAEPIDLGDYPAYQASIVFLP